MNNLASNINIVQIPFAPFVDGVHRAVKLSEHLTVGELYDATKVPDKRDLLESGIPIHKNLYKVFELIRSHTKKPLYLGSAFRSYEWELKQGRSGNSQHINANAYDFNGQNLKKVIDIAVHTENALFQELRGLGVTAFGKYSWGWHLDFRPEKPTKDIYFWNEEKKNADNYVIPVVIGFIILIIVKLKLYKNGFKR